jgi:uncharacterized repeat protein (TIGR03803 family)
MRIAQNRRRASLLPLVTCVLAGTAAQAQAATETVIHNFGNFPKGANPYGTLFRSAGGVLYGTTYQGGAANLGMVFELSAVGYKALYSFKGGADGANPYAGVSQDSSGNLYGTTYQGGSGNAGVVYKLTPSGQETVLYSFTVGADGGSPYAGVIVDSGGNLYGTAYNGGLTNCSGGCGVVYKVDQSGQETVLYSFTGGADGASPYAGVISDPAGNLYGTTYGGGESGNPEGVVFRLSTSGVETVLHTFADGHPGGSPHAGLIRDSAGNLYGTASDVVYKLDASGQFTALRAFDCAHGGGGELWTGVALDAAGNLYGTTITPTSSDCGPPYGIVYKLDTAGTLKVVYRFPGASHQERESAPGFNAGVVLDSAGGIYGTTPYGGVSGMIYKIGGSGVTMLYDFSGAAGGTNPNTVAINAMDGGLYGATYYGGPANVGTVYELNPAGRETVLYGFSGGADGAYPSGVLARDSAGTLYGTTTRGGGANEGVVYKVDASGQFTVLHTFTGGADGGLPEAGVVLGSDGNLYGTTTFGGTGSKTGLQEGVVFKLDPAGNETVLYSFTGLSDGGTPETGVVRDSSGDLYGTTLYGGHGAGVVFKLDAAGRYTVLHSFTGGSDGGYPAAGVVLGPSGTLYGTASDYGVTRNGDRGEGVVFELSASRILTPLYTFTGGADGGGPTAVARDRAGNLYGATSAGGDMACVGGCGVAFEVDPSGQETVLHAFTNGADGVGGAALALGAAGDLYGNSWGSGIAGGGLVYRLNLPGVGTTPPGAR